MRLIKSTTPFFQTTVLGLGILFSASCKTYHIPIDSFKEQFTITDSSQLKPVILGGSTLLYTQKYLTKNIDYVDCIDKKGQHHRLKMGPKLETRLSYQKGDKTKRSYFYLDRVYVSKDSVTGYRSRFFGLPKSIPLQDLKQVNIQNGHKNFYYLNP
ncbi:MAG TPA: hypothetical protein VFL76_11415 [Edaphocola sp.]|nr:hypothetical protein [Edaphocola sp.]